MEFIIFQPWLDQIWILEFSFIDSPSTNDVDMDCHNNLFHLKSLLPEPHHATVDPNYFSDTQTKYLNSLIADTIPHFLFYCDCMKKAKFLIAPLFSNG